MTHYHGLSRRKLLQAGGAGAAGLLGLSSVPTWAKPSAAGAADKDMSCIFVFLSGGPSHHETFDPKPTAPVNIRGPYGSIATNVPTIQISEFLPQLSQHMDKCTILRSMTSRDEHAGNTMMSGGNKAVASYGAVLAKLKSATGQMPPFVHVGPAGYLPGSGQLGAAYSPIVIADPLGKQVQLPGFTPLAEVPTDRLYQRRDLLASVDLGRADLASLQAVEKMDVNYRRAIDMLSSDKVRKAFDLAHEKETLRETYGAHTFGQSCLLARRLVEAGTRFVQVNYYDGPAWHGWDVHGADLPGLARMESPLCPRLDQAVAALLEDLSQRGLLQKTLVVVTGEFGRTPNVNKYGGRDHWPRCFSMLLAGGGVPAGAVVGASDRTGGYPVERPVTVAQFAATFYKLMGIEITIDERIRPFLDDPIAVPELIA